MKNKQRNFQFQVKALDEEKMTFEGYGSIFGNVDSYNDVVVKGAFMQTLQERKGKFKILWQHKWDMPIGKIIEAKEDDIGLWIKAEISDTPKGREAFTLLKDGVLDELSIGYSIVKDEYDHDEGIRYLRQVELFEVSIVSFAANSLARVTDVKSLFDRLNIKQDLESRLEGQELTRERWDIESAFNEVIYDLLEDNEMSEEDKLSEFQTSLEQFSDLMTEWFNQMLSLEKSKLKSYLFRTKSVVDFQDLPLAERDMDWNGNEAEENLRIYASSDDSGDKETINWDVYKNGFLWYEEEDEENFTSYKFPIADIVDGEMVAVPNGIFTAAAILQGAMLEEGAPSINVPRQDIEGMKEHLTMYYAKMRDEFDDENLIAPWNEAEDSKDNQLLFSIMNLCYRKSLQTKEGRVLSASNRKLIKEAVEALLSLLNETETDISKSKKDNCLKEKDYEESLSLIEEIKNLLNTKESE